MKQPAIVSFGRRRAAAPAAARNRRLVWGLSARLPRWSAFDGRRSKVAVTSRRSTDQTQMRTPTRDK
jgi:hypothetical protein